MPPQYSTCLDKCAFCKNMNCPYNPNRQQMQYHAKPEVPYNVQNQTQQQQTDIADPIIQAISASHQLLTDKIEVNSKDLLALSAIIREKSLGTDNVSSFSELQTRHDEINKNVIDSFSALNNKLDAILSLVTNKIEENSFNDYKNDMVVERKEQPEIVSRVSDIETKSVDEIIANESSLVVIADEELKDEDDKKANGILSFFTK